MKTALIQRIQKTISEAESQSISFATFMQLALYDPQDGYYMSSVTLGRQGDFITGPELGNVFAAALAQQFVEVHDRVGPASSVLELGAGSGRLAYEILLHLSSLDRLPETYYIMELSGYLRSQQEARLKALPKAVYDRVQWCDHLPRISGMILANEVLDAMPVHKVLYQKGLWQEISVGLDKAGSFCWKTQPINSKRLSLACHALSPFVDGIDDYETEINLMLDPWIQSLSTSLASGLMLLIDYGFPRAVYYHPSRYMGTLMCHRAQRMQTDPLINVGEQDITAHVDFTAVAEAAVSAGLEVNGYTEQAYYLLSLDVLNAVKTFEDRQALKLLTLAHEMGEIFKVMALSHEAITWRGFKMNDKRGRL